MNNHLDFNIPVLNTDNKCLNHAFRIALGDITSNILPWKGGLLTETAYAAMAGIDYNKPWTRDASINAYNGLPWLSPQISYNTLISVLTHEPDCGTIIGGQYWDAVIWVTAAWNHYLYTGDEKFLKLSFQVASNSLKFFEDTEFDEKSNLFRGPACFQDGVSAYPDYYIVGQGSGIFKWPETHPDKAIKKGFGIPMKTLSTNCLYYNAYVTIEKMAKELNLKINHQWKQKADRLKQSINTHFWNDEKGLYDYIADSPENSDYQEGIGHAFALIFGIPDESQTASIFDKIYIAKAGIPCVWPTFDRYRKDENSFGRHSGPVWPQVQGFWAQACALYDQKSGFSHEMFNLAQNVRRDNQFVEIYHPATGMPYGGLQEGRFDGQIKPWKATNRQTWSATAFLSMIVKGLAGLRFQTDGLAFKPILPEGINDIELSNLLYRGSYIDVHVSGNGSTIQSVHINGQPVDKPFINKEKTGRTVVKITLK